MAPIVIDPILLDPGNSAFVIADLAIPEDRIETVIDIGHCGLPRASRPARRRRCALRPRFAVAALRRRHAH